MPPDRQNPRDPRLDRIRIVNEDGVPLDLEGFLGGLTEERVQDLLTNPPEEDNELIRWPIISCRVPEHPLDEEASTSIRREIDAAKAAVQVAMGRLEEQEGPPSDSDTHFRALTDILLKHAKTPEQITRLVQGYIQTQIMLTMKDNFHIQVAGPDGRISDTQVIEEQIVEATPARWQTLTDCARIPEWIVFRHALDTKSFETYALESGNDSAFTLMADPTDVYLLDFDPEQEETEIPKIKRKTPESKRMTTEKLARLFQLPSLQRLIETDAYERHPAAIGTNLATLTEYFCENDDVIYKNRITAEDIQKWLEDKFATHRPPAEVAWYVWAKLQGTSFERAGIFIEQYILDIHAIRHPWLFELGMKKREQCLSTRSLFELYRNALMTCKFSLRQEDKSKYQELLSILPSIALFQTFLASKIYGGDKNIQYVLSHYSEHADDFVPEYKCLAEIDLAVDSLELLRKALDEETDPPYEWVVIDGFELLDPMEIYKTQTLNRYHGLATAMAPALKKLLATEDATVLLRFKREVIYRLHPVKQKVLKHLIEKAALPIATKILFEESQSDTVVAIARGEESTSIPTKIILPGDVEWETLVEKKFDPRCLSTAAERELLRRHLKGARGADEIAQYLMAHVGTMRPSEVVRPTSESPHDEIVREYGESPDLLAILDMTTLLTYLGYTPDQIKAEIEAQATLAALSSRPELATIGVESELVSTSPEGPIINPQTFKWLFNILPRDPKDAVVNEIMTAPTTSPVMQAMLFSLMTDPRFRLVHVERLWEQTAREDRSPSSLHLNISIPPGLPFTSDLIHGYMNDLQRMQWIACGGDAKQRPIAKGRVSRWRPFSLLDVMGVDKTTKAEIRNLRLEEHGEHVTRMKQLQLLASACIQLMREQAGLKLSESGRVMAEIYQKFQIESHSIRGTEPGAAIAAEQLITRYSAEIEQELHLPPISKKEGIIIL